MPFKELSTCDALPVLVAIIVASWRILDDSSHSAPFFFNSPAVYCNGSAASPLLGVPCAYLYGPGWWEPQWKNALEPVFAD